MERSDASREEQNMAGEVDESGLDTMVAGCKTPENVAPVNS